MRRGLLAGDRQRKFDVRCRAPCLLELVAERRDPGRRLGQRALALGDRFRDLRAGRFGRRLELLDARLRSNDPLPGLRAQLVELAAGGRVRLGQLAADLGELGGHLAAGLLARLDRGQL